MGAVDSWNKNDTLGIYLPPKHVCGALSVKPRSMDCSVNALKELKKQKKVRDLATSPLRPPYTPKVACLNFDLWGRVLDVVNHDKFQLYRFRSVGAPGGWISLSPIDWRYRPYNSIRTNVLHCDQTAHWHILYATQSKPLNFTFSDLWPKQPRYDWWTPLIIRFWESWAWVASQQVWRNLAVTA